MTDEKVLARVREKLGIVRPPIMAHVHTSSLIQAIEDEGYGISNSMYDAIASLEYCIQEELDKKALEEQND